MKSKLLGPDGMTLRFSLRSRSVRGIANYFSEEYKPNLSCPVCSMHFDSLQEILNCTKLKSEVRSIQEEIQDSIANICKAKGQL